MFYLVVFFSRSELVPLIQLTLPRTPGKTLPSGRRLARGILDTFVSSSTRRRSKTSVALSKEQSCRMIDIPRTVRLAPL